MKLFLFSIILMIFSACSNDENIQESKSLVKSTTTVDVSHQGIFAMCAECHGSDGKNRALGRSKVIAGWEVTRVEKALRGFIAGTYGGPMSGLMRERIKDLSDAEITEVAQYISNLK